MCNKLDLKKFHLFKLKIIINGYIDNKVRPKNKNFEKFFVHSYKLTYFYGCDLSKYYPFLI